MLPPSALQPPVEQAPPITPKEAVAKSSLRQRNGLPGTSRKRKDDGDISAGVEEVVTKPSTPPQGSRWGIVLRSAKQWYLAVGYLFISVIRSGIPTWITLYLLENKVRMVMARSRLIPCSQKLCQNLPTLAGSLSLITFEVGSFAGGLCAGVSFICPSMGHTHHASKQVVCPTSSEESEAR